MTSTCPDCDGTLAPGAMRCRCGWVQQRMGQVVTPHVVPCDECGKPARRVGVRLICGDCEAAERHAESEKFCAAHGLVTREDMMAFCKRQARTFGRAQSFEGWAQGIKQQAVDFLVRDDSTGSREALERLRAEGAVDGRNQVIPAEARAVAKAAYRAERSRHIVEVQEQLAKLSKTEAPA